MNTVATYTSAAGLCSQAITQQYSTSFSWAIRLLHKDLRAAIHAIYGFVRLADEIVDTFHDFDKKQLLLHFREETFTAIRTGISLNPILQSFRDTVNQYRIRQEFIEAFLLSMTLDLDKTTYIDNRELDEYIYGSAEVVGLMCLQVFCEGNDQLFGELKPAAQKLGAAFQKVNFLRDLSDDCTSLHRNYFPGISFHTFNKQVKQAIEENIEADFQQAYKGICTLPVKARFGVYVAYRYYFSLLKKIKRQQPANMLQQRVRIPDYRKLAIILDAGLRSRLRLL